jgi:hypothetical protein
MKTAPYLLLSLLALSTGCDKLDVAKNTPDCIKKEIKKIDGNPCKEGANVQEYIFKEKTGNKTVYVIDYGNCGADFTFPVIDSDCNELGELGGITGTRDINGQNFYANAEYVRTVWEQ